MFTAYILPVLIFIALGIFAGVLLTVVSKIFAVETDPRIESVNEALPQVNCGACGYSGCEDYAKAIVENGEKTNLCKPGGDKSSAKIAQIMGTEAADAVKSVAVVRCLGNCDAERYDFDFDGVMTCENAKRFYGGMWGCKFGCLGLGDCANVCPEDAICITDGLAKVIPERCIACGLCAKVCPNNIIDIKNSADKVEVLCSSRDAGKTVRAVCKNGCIGCRICEKQCEFDAIHVKDNIAVIDHSKCTACGKCVEKCPAHVIKMMDK